MVHYLVKLDDELIQALRAIPAMVKKIDELEGHLVRPDSGYHPAQKEAEICSLKKTIEELHDQLRQQHQHTADQRAELMKLRLERAVPATSYPGVDFSVVAALREQITSLKKSIAQRDELVARLYSLLIGEPMAKVGETEKNS